MGLFKGATSQRDAQVSLGAFLLNLLDLDAAEKALTRAQSAGSARAAGLLDVLPKLRNLMYEAPVKSGRGQVRARRRRLLIVNGPCLSWRWLLRRRKTALGFAPVVGH